MVFLRNFWALKQLAFSSRAGGWEPASTNQSVATANDWPQHAASCHILLKLAAITIKVGALLQDEGPWFFTLFSREEPLFPFVFMCCQ